MPRLLRNWPRRLHSLDGAQTFAIEQYLEDLCSDFSMMLSSELHPQRVIVVEGIEIELPADTAIPLGFIASELITNAAKYGIGRITVSWILILKGATRCRYPTTAGVCLMDLIEPTTKGWE